MKLSTEKNSKRSMTETEFVRFLLPSLLSILLCAVCLISLTWAWFSEEVVSGDNIIRAGSFEVTVQLDGNELVGAEKVEATLQVTASGEQPHKLTISPRSDISGYCIIKVTSGGVVTQYQTPVLNSNSASYEVSITVKDGPVDITVSTHWGKATVPGAVQITDNTLVLTGVATATISETTATETTETTETEIGTGATDD